MQAMDALLFYCSLGYELERVAQPFITKME